jgi:hypothetical protein
MEGLKTFEDSYEEYLRTFPYGVDDGDDQDRD